MKTKRSQLKYPPIDDSKKVSYLLLHLGVPSAFVSSLDEHVRVAQRAAKTVGIELSTIDIDIENSKGPKLPRYLFRFPYYRRKDELASRFANTVLIVASITYGPFFDERNDVSTFRIPMSLIRNRKSVYLEELLQLEESRSWDERIAEFSPGSIIGSAVYFSHYNVEMAWKFTPLLLSNDRFLRAFRFLKTSQENFFVWPRAIDDVVEESDQTPKNVFHQSWFENALQDSFKAIEAIISDPPKDNEKFFRKIISIGLDPNMKFGFTNKPIYQVIRDMNEARDKKAAHGSTSKRNILIGELLEYQYCARYIVLEAAKFEIGGVKQFTTD